MEEGSADEGVRTQRELISMWLFTKYGFFSVVCASQGDVRHGQPVDEARMMVRARARGPCGGPPVALRAEGRLDDRRGGPRRGDRLKSEVARVQGRAGAGLRKGSARRLGGHVRASGALGRPGWPAALLRPGWAET